MQATVFVVVVAQLLLIAYLYDRARRATVATRAWRAEYYVVAADRDQWRFRWNRDAAPHVRYPDCRLGLRVVREEEVPRGR